MIIKGQPKDWSEEDQFNAAKWLSKKPLPELRKRQAIINSQIASVWRRLQTPSSSKAFLERALENLRVMESVETLAVGIKCFPEDFDHPPTKALDNSEKCGILQT